ncbi:hypothetical protein N9242_00935 [Vicingaceae bacterium]|nr:hypothetical protein [Vicingaceae bacterium]
MITSEYNSPIIKITSANDITEQRRIERRENAINNFLLTSGTIIAAAYGGNMLLKNGSIRKFFDSSIMDATMKETAQGRSWDSLFSDGTGKSKFAFFEGVRKLEELSPFRVMRTLQLSHMLMPFVTGKDTKVDLSANLVRSQESFFRGMLKSRGEVELSTDHLRYGFKLEDGKLYAATESGTRGELVAKSARLMIPHMALPKDDTGKEIIYANKILKQYATIVTGSTTDSFSKLIGSNTEPYVVAIGKSDKQLSFDLFRSYARNVMAQGSKVLDAPFEHITEMFPQLEKNKYFDALKDIIKPGLGTDGNYRQSIGKSVLDMAWNQRKIISLISTFYAVDAAAQYVAPEDSSFSKGIISGIATMAVNTHLAFAEGFSDNFQGYKEAQEYYAPDSTSLLTMAGTPLALGTALATGSYAKRLYDNSVHGIQVSEMNAEKMVQVMPDNISKYLPDKVSNFKATRAKRLGIYGVLAGLALEAPFIPGALIGEDSDTLSKEYSGEKDIAIRANRWWFTGSSRYGGDHIKYFDKSGYAKLMANTEDVSKYGEENTEEVKRSLNPILHPFDYLRDPYRFEKMSSEDRPYPIWGLDVSAATFVGKLYEKTLGAIVKPDIINPELAPYLSNAEPGTVITGEATVTTKGIEKALDDKTFSLRTKVSEGDASLIAEGKLIAPAAATYDPNAEALGWSWEAFKDFIGLKGWLLGEAEEALGAPTTQLSPQLARSGEVTNVANVIRDANLGGLFSLTEPQRRYIPTSASVTKDRINPLKNNMPSWLPGEEDRFWLNLQEGDPFLKIEHGTSRLPGVGYSTLHSELKGINPEDYPDIYKFKILSDVAMGSDAYYSAKNNIEKRSEAGGLTEYEQRLYKESKKQEYLRAQKKEFREYKSEAELETASSLQRLANAYYETGTHNLEKALPSEFLTFFRPAGKMVHQRTAIEDYQRTQLEGSDSAIWTKPIDHFINPAVIATRRLVDGDFISEDIKEKRSIDQYFDTLEYVKQRKIYKEASDNGDTATANAARYAYQKTTEGAIASGLDTDQEILRSYISLPKAEKDYFSSFVNANEADRAEIKSILPSRIASLYTTIWERKDIIDRAIANGATAEQANEEVKNRVEKEDSILATENQEDHKAWIKDKSKGKGSFREHLADNRASEYLENTGGTPDKDFSGWDPRIDMDKIKLRALTIGGEDFFKYGFWKDDKIDLERYTSVMSDKNPKEIISRIKENLKQELDVRDQVENSLHKEGYIINSVDVRRGGDGVDIRVETT